MTEANYCGTIFDSLEDLTGGAQLAQGASLGSIEKNS
jgi:hypothetical protein